MVQDPKGIIDCARERSLFWSLLK